MKDEKLFVRFLITRKGFQQVTVRAYAATIKRITREIGEYPSGERAEQFVEKLYTSEYSYHHKLNTVLALEQYLAFLGRPTRYGRPKKPRPIITDTLTEGEVARLLLCCKNIREKALLSLLAYSGIRNLELCNLRMRDCLVMQNAIKIIRGKGLKDGISEIAPECTSVLREYLAAFPRNAKDFLFTTLVHGNQLCTCDVRKMVLTVSRRTEIKKRIYPHLFRHSMTANMLLRGADLMSIRSQLRHNLLETTLHYANSIVFVERNRYQRFAPSYL